MSNARTQDTNQGPEIRNVGNPNLSCLDNSGFLTTDNTDSPENTVIITNLPFNQIDVLQFLFRCYIEQLYIFFNFWQLYINYDTSSINYLTYYDASWNFIIVPGFILRLSILETILQLMFYLTCAFGFSTTEHKYTLLMSNNGFNLKLSCRIFWSFQAISNFLIMCYNLQISKCKNHYFPFWI